MSYNPQAFGAIRNIQNRYDSSFSGQQVSTTLVELNSTRVEYTPSASATSVIYEAMYSFAWTPDRYQSFMNLRLQYSTDASTWTTIDSSKVFAGNGPSNNDTRWQLYSTVFTLPAWTGPRYLRLAARSHSTSDEFKWGRSYTSTSEGPGFSPMISVYSLEA